MHMHDSPMPRAPLLAAGALVVLAIAGSAWVRWTGIGASTVVATPATSARSLRFEDRNDGGVSVIDAASGRVARVLKPGEDGFIRATLRTLARERKRRDIGSDVPFVLRTHGDGRLTLEDPALNRLIDLEAFGPTNAGAFARLIQQGQETRP